jgi:aminopeptidase N
MHAAARRSISPELKQIVQQASHALARLDADRLEDLAASCAALKRDVHLADAMERAQLAREAQQAAADMAVFAHILEATRSNLAVMRRLRDLRQGRIEYGAPFALPEKHHGID